ncbi:hypothetical protein EMIHUDRAFT_206118 [Emiliania huxleyi CCMP1516]|uniref:RING-type domain-containing protein n=2 Tax=Emiliania huxleyi TaxID=2903 RepID=A0A0D3JNH1_EMIH1|nr:hypothetical protein EMIHUDRAFT_206118 [Emiliania huxleyi CCMP1516]EOD25056.1 hypothetical protein EMIHUDRAFT_206118 [Emiliania huxleyi CCMP1516]|eukprot:XP_005777485.1 hypothetical protein EMIHUDRAFT_206118 [Emiliania huxleyi CCMP1516]
MLACGAFGADCSICMCPHDASDAVRVLPCRFSRSDACPNCKSSVCLEADGGDDGEGDAALAAGVGLRGE